jgi:hypothetical protein
VRNAAAIAGRRYDGKLVMERERFDERGDAGRVDAVVVGNENAQFLGRAGGDEP